VQSTGMQYHHFMAILIMFNINYTENHVMRDQSVSVSSYKCEEFIFTHNKNWKLRLSLCFKSGIHIKSEVTRFNVLSDFVKMLGLSSFRAPEMTSIHKYFYMSNGKSSLYILVC
jgi:hypothetical protein